MNKIVESVIEEASRRKAKSVSEVHLVIGELAFLGEEQAKMWFDLLKENTILKRAKLFIEQENGKVRCPNCSYEGSIKNLDVADHHAAFPAIGCPKCGSPVEIISGRDCIVKTVKLTV
jgi:hydrogenase nickel insertion protein HypA